MNDPRHEPTPQETADLVARSFFGVTDEGARQRVILQLLTSVVWLTLLVPAIFYLRFGRVGPLGWGTTVFFDVYCLLAAVGLYFRPRTEYHTRVRARGDWLDRVGAFWLVGCTFGPLTGWVFTTGTFPITQGSWRWLYAARFLFAAALPILLALPLTRYARGRAAWVALPLLFGVTALPVSTATYVTRDLWDGPAVLEDPTTGRSYLHLKHTGRVLGDAR